MTDSEAGHERRNQDTPCTARTADSPCRASQDGSRYVPAKTKLVIGVHLDMLGPYAVSYAFKAKAI